MIIECVKCNKKFDVKASLIPENGRNIQCGSCNHIWFYKKDDLRDPVVNEEVNNNQFKEKNEIIKRNKLAKAKVKKNTNQESENKNLSKSKNINDLEIEETSTNKSKDGLSLVKIFSYIIVMIISFIALIIFLDTFKYPLNKIFPNLEQILFSLFETLKDIYLFITNLII